MTFMKMLLSKIKNNLRNLYNEDDSCNNTIIFFDYL